MYGASTVQGETEAETETETEHLVWRRLCRGVVDPRVRISTSSSRPRLQFLALNPMLLLEWGATASKYWLEMGKTTNSPSALCEQGRDLSQYEEKIGPGVCERGQWYSEVSPANDRPAVSTWNHGIRSTYGVLDDAGDSID